jgi:hypothetical protein
MVMRVLPGADGTTGPRFALEKSYRLRISSLVMLPLSGACPACGDNSNVFRGVSEHRHQDSTRRISSQSDEPLFPYSVRVRNGEPPRILKGQSCIRKVNLVLG